MNTKKITVFVLMVMVLSANAFSIRNENIQDKKKVTAVCTFDGYDEDDGYSFLFKGEDDDEDSEETVYFLEITEEALNAVNLKSKDMIGKRFEITYEVTEYEVVEDNGTKETYERLKIIQVKTL